jgi:hypothetical protein
VSFTRNYLSAKTDAIMSYPMFAKIEEVGALALTSSCLFNSHNRSAGVTKPNYSLRSGVFWTFEGESLTEAMMITFVAGPTFRPQTKA